MPEVTPLQAAINNAERAAHSYGPERAKCMTRSWQAFLDHVQSTRDSQSVPPSFGYLQDVVSTPMPTELREWVTAAGKVDELAGYVARVERAAFERGREAERERLPLATASAYRIDEALKLLPRVEDLEVRAPLAQALGHPLPKPTPEEPDPGRDWHQVEGHLFKPSGKWMYQVALDYTPYRHTGVRGEGPDGWHFDGAVMARKALFVATERGISGVTLSEIPAGWRLFVQHPPQGYPIYAVGPHSDEYAEHFVGSVKENSAQHKLDRIRGVTTSIVAGSDSARLDRIREVLES